MTKIPNVLFQNQGDGTFQDVALIAGVAYNGDGDAEAGMGADFGDYDQDGDPDLYVTHFFTETNTLYRNEGGARFSDVTTTAGLAGGHSRDVGLWERAFSTTPTTARLDLFVANGHVYPQVDQAETGTTYRQPNQLFRNEGGGRFAPVSAGPGLAQAKVSRGTSFGDYDDDGDIDLLRRRAQRRANSVAQRWGKCEKLSRGTGLWPRRQSRWDRALASVCKPPTSASGARSTVQPATSRTAICASTSAWARRKPSTAVEIVYPNGSTYAVENVPANKLLVVRQGQGHGPPRIRRKSFLTINPRCARPAPARFRRAAVARQRIRDEV